MQTRFSRQTIAGVVASVVLLFLFFVLQLGLPSIVLSILVFIGTLLFLSSKPEKKVEVVERQFTIADLQESLSKIASDGLPGEIASTVEEVVQQGKKILLYLQEYPQEAPSCLFQVMSTLNGVQLAIETFRPLAKRVEGKADPTVTLIRNYILSASQTLAKTYSGLVQRDRQAVEQLVDTLSRQQRAMDEINQILGKE